MAIITDYKDDHDDHQPGSPSKSKPTSNPTHTPTPSNPNPNPNPFTFWFYLTLTTTLITFFFILLSTLSSKDPKAWFLSLPTNLRTYYSMGRPIKVQITPNDPQVEVFTYSQGSKTSENVLILHGLGCTSFSFRHLVDHFGSKGLFGVAIDLPGSGFSDKSVVREKDYVVGGGVLERFWDVFNEIREKGVFWHFDNLIEHGHLPPEEAREETQVRIKKVVEPLELGSLEMGRVLGQVVDSLGLAPFHLVLHDSALVMCANWVVDNVKSLRSVTLIDVVDMPKSTALPLWVLDMPLVRDVVLGVDFVFRKLIDSCCSKMNVGFDVEAHRVLLKGRDGRGSIVAIGKKLNQSFDLGDWARSDALKSLPMQVLWSSSWSDEWSEKGRRASEVVSQAKFIKHSGGRWPQDDTSMEVAEHIINFVSSLPKTDRKVDEEPLPEHIQKMLDEAKSGNHHHHHHGHGSHDGHGHGHGHDAHAGYMNAYGLGNDHGHGHGWGM